MGGGGRAAALWAHECLASPPGEASSSGGCGGCGLASLDVSSCHQLGDETVVAVAAALAGCLTCLDISNCWQAGPVGWAGDDCCPHQDVPGGGRNSRDPGGGLGVPRTQFRRGQPRWPPALPRAPFCATCRPKPLVFGPCLCPAGHQRCAPQHVSAAKVLGAAPRGNAYKCMRFACPLLCHLPGCLHRACASGLSAWPAAGSWLRPLT
jgi:hypothetical protein